MGVLYGRPGRLTAENGGSRPGQKLPKSVGCSLAQPHGICVRSLWPQISPPPQPNVNGGVPHAANLTAHLELLHRTLPLGIPGC
jgi:hypothetical protein